jgi:NAD(P)-dependent dehydrogenase (short-subunit alcohol dehydrogenase family)
MLWQESPSPYKSCVASARYRKTLIYTSTTNSSPYLAMTAEARSSALSSIPQGRFGTVEEVADAVLFLATNPYANNCVLNLDGGLSAI